MEASQTVIPNLSLQPPSADFIVHHAHAYHPSFSTPPSHYDSNLGYFVVTPQLSTEMSSPQQSLPSSNNPPRSATGNTLLPRPLARPAAALDFWDSLFDEAMKKFKTLYPKDPKESEDPKDPKRPKDPKDPKETPKKSNCIREKRNWTDVYDELEKAREVYCKEKGGFRASFRKVYRKVGDKAVNPFLCASKFVPDIDYVTPVLGAVQVLLEAAKTASKVRAEILTAVDDIDLKFSQVEMFFKEFEGDENIRKACVKLIVSVFYAIECAIGFFLKSVFKRGFSAIFTADEYQQKVRDGLGAINTQSAELLSEAEMSDMDKRSQFMKELLARTAAWKDEQDKALQRMNQIQQGQEIIRHETNSYFKALLDGHINQAMEARREYQATRQQLQTMQRNLANLAGALHEASRPQSPMPPAVMAPSSQCMDAQRLLDLIDIPDLGTHDLEYIGKRRNALVPLDEQARAQQIMHSSQFQEWMLSPTSSQLLVHGDYTDDERRLSGLSLICEAFINSLAERAPRFLHVFFFCGLHADPPTDEYTGGGRALIETFICQLLLQYDFGATIPNPAFAEEFIRCGDIDMMCAVFGYLVRRLPADVTLVCIVDGAVYYERPSFVDDMAAVLVEILKLSDEQNTEAPVKVLVTSPTTTTEIRGSFPESLVLSMEAMPRTGMEASRLRAERLLGGGLEAVD